jgi:hypothetical protein
MFTEHETWSDGDGTEFQIEVDAVSGANIDGQDLPSGEWISEGRLQRGKPVCVWQVFLATFTTRDTKVTKEQVVK